MVVPHASKSTLQELTLQASVVLNSFPTYWYEGFCPHSSDRFCLPRTLGAEAIARELMQQLARDDRHSREGKMYGVLLVETPSQGLRVLKAFSGLLNGDRAVEGWVPPIPGRDQVVLAEAHTLQRLEVLKQELIALQPDRQQHQALLQSLSESFEAELQQLASCHHQRQQERQRQRQMLRAAATPDDSIAAALEQLDEQSRRDGRERRKLKHQRDAVLQPLKAAIDQTNAQIRHLKQQRKALSQQLQQQMHASYWLANFAGETQPLQQLMPPDSIPTGTGDCCAPKLLHYAATHGLKPLAMAEFWWGAAVREDKVPGEFYGACRERCQPLMGFLLSGLPQRGSMGTARSSTIASPTRIELPILYEDQWLIAVDKPAGLLSVPGRSADRQDSILSRFQHLLPNEAIATVHRLDQETSGVLLLARDRQTHRDLSQQFHQRRIYKAYEAVLSGEITATEGTIDLPLLGDPIDRPRQTVNWQRGKPSVTQFRVIATGRGARVEFLPITGRTHQIRVHAADPQGLGVPILGDRLYHSQGDGQSLVEHRLHLHARELNFEHPQSGQTVRLRSKTPF